MDLNEIWNRIFHNPVEIDLSVLSAKDFKEVVESIQKQITNEIDVDWKRKSIRINF